MTPEDRTILERLFPIAPAPYTIRPGGNVGLVIVDPVQGSTCNGNLERILRKTGYDSAAHQAVECEV